MRYIPLSRGYQAIVDDADYEAVSSFKWTAQVHRRPQSVLVYAKRNIRDVDQRVRTLWLHRVIVGVTDPEIQVDHRDHDGLNCRRYNLRVVTGIQNLANRRINGGPKSSRFKGVHWDKRREKWMARIMSHCKYTYLGRFAVEEDAARAYDAAAIKLSGRYACLNFSGEIS